jgi:hypothetical protein
MTTWQKVVPPGQTLLHETRATLAPSTKGRAYFTEKYFVFLPGVLHRSAEPIVLPYADLDSFWVNDAEGAVSAQAGVTQPGFTLRPREGSDLVFLDRTPDAGLDVLERRTGRARGAGEPPVKSSWRL